MKKFFTLVFISILLVSNSQVTITSADLPDAGDLLVQKNCALTGSVDLEETGPDHSWTFNDDVLMDLGSTTETNCLDVSDAPFVYQVFFNNPFDPEHDADYCFGVDEFTIGTITFEDVYRYMRNSSSVYSFVGSGWTISGVPLPSWSDPVDVIYELPINFDDESSSYSEIATEIPTLGYYELKQTRTNVVNGWGEITVWGQTYDVLRVRTEIEASDSIYIEFLGFGTNFDRPLEVDYKWLSPAFKVPILQVNEIGGIVTQVLTADITVAVAEVDGITFNLSPNPVNDQLNVATNSNKQYELSIFDMNGNKVLAETRNGNATIDVSGFANGNYMCVAYMENERVRTFDFVKE